MATGGAGHHVGCDTIVVLVAVEAAYFVRVIRNPEIPCPVAAIAPQNGPVAGFEGGHAVFGEQDRPSRPHLDFDQPTDILPPRHLAANGGGKRGQVAFRGRGGRGDRTRQCGSEENRGHQHHDGSRDEGEAEQTPAPPRRGIRVTEGAETCGIGGVATRDVELIPECPQQQIGDDEHPQAEGQQRQRQEQGHADGGLRVEQPPPVHLKSRQWDRVDEDEAGEPHLGGPFPESQEPEERKRGAEQQELIDVALRNGETIPPRAGQQQRDEEGDQPADPQRSQDQHPAVRGDGGVARVGVGGVVRGLGHVPHY